MEKIRYTVRPGGLLRHVWAICVPGRNSDQRRGEWKETRARLFWGTFRPKRLPAGLAVAGLTYHLDSNISFKVAPVLYSYVGHGNSSAGFYGPFVGQGINGFTFNPNQHTATPPLTSTTIPWNRSTTAFNLTPPPTTATTKPA